MVFAPEQTANAGGWSSGMILRSGRRGREFDSPVTPSVYASIAQMVERKTLNLVVVGSIPIEGAF